MRRGKTDQELESYGCSFFLPRQDPAFWQSIGCDAPKLRFASRVMTAKTAAEAERLFRDLPDPQHTVLLSGGGPGPPTESPGGDGIGKVMVRAFTANRLRLETQISAKNPLWLVYADAYHPRWQATVNGQPVAISRANLGFKAVPVPPGQSQVVFEFRRGFMGTLALFVAVSSLLSALGLAATMLFFLVFPGWKRA